MIDNSPSDQPLPSELRAALARAGKLVDDAPASGHRAGRVHTGIHHGDLSLLALALRDCASPRPW